MRTNLSYGRDIMYHDRLHLPVYNDLRPATEKEFESQRPVIEKQAPLTE